jgi:hypothetical protein
VTDGRGALNVGLLVKVDGEVTYAGTGFFYVWDGSNRETTPIDDGSGHYGIRITSNHVATAGDRKEITGISTTDTYNVPGRNIPTIMPRDNNDIVTNPAPTTVPSPDGAFMTGWCISTLPAIPADPDPPQVFGAIPVSGMLFRWEALRSSFVMYDEWSPGSYGGMLLGDGFWLWTDSPATVSYQGRYQSEDQWVTLPVADWTIIGQTFDHDTLWSDVKVHNGKELVSMEEACRNRYWLQSVAWWWDNTCQGLRTLGLPDDFPSSEQLKKWHGYWVWSEIDDLSLLIPAGPIAP